MGLGNPGADYNRTRHNCGFRAIDRLAQQLGCKINKAKFQGLYGQATVSGKKLYLLKPLTYMNNSGSSVLQMSAYFNIPPQRIVVLFDDISLGLGKMRIRKNGSAGGHNGIKSIISQLGSQEFPRVKIGVGEKPYPDMDLVDWVLSAFSSSEEKVLESIWEDAANAALCIAEHGTDAAASQYNRK